MTGPLYIAEQLPLDWRGPMTVCYQLLITIGILMGSILAGVFEPVPNGWRLVSLTKYLGFQVTSSIGQLRRFHDVKGYKICT